MGVCGQNCHELTCSVSIDGLLLKQLPHSVYKTTFISVKKKESEIRVNRSFNCLAWPPLIWQPTAPSVKISFVIHLLIDFVQLHINLLTLQGPEFHNY